jgi:hypothetical protein
VNQRYTIHVQNLFLGIEACLIYSRVGDSVHVDSWHTTFKRTMDVYIFRVYGNFELVYQVHNKERARVMLQEVFDRLDVSHENQFHLLKAIG